MIVGKTDLLSDHFDSKQSMEAIDLPSTCHPSPTQLKIKAVATVDCGSIMYCDIGAIRHRHG